MKILITLAVVALLIVAAMFFFGGGELAIAPKPTPGADADTPPLNFTPLVGLLEKDMSGIPASLDDSGTTPANAFRVKGRLQGASAARPEYQTLSQACELIIDADKEHSVRQMQDRQAEHGVSGDPMANAQAQQGAVSAARTTLHAKAQADWAAYRQQTDAEVHRLLGSLQNAKP